MELTRRKEQICQKRKRPPYPTFYRLIAGLDKFERAIILLWLDENSYDEIAEIVGVPRNTVASRLKRIKEKLTKQANS